VVCVRFSFFQMILHYKRTTNKGHDGENCIICGDYGKGRETWFRCTICGKWAHKDCTGADTLNDYRCDFCNNE
jgi:hypothetical protein